MLFEIYDFGLDARTLHLLFGAGLGLIFGIAAQISRFCLRRTAVGPADARATAGAVWLTALATAIIGFAIASSFGLVDISEHRFASTSIPLPAIVLGGALFGIGMVLTRGCVSRLTVLSATGNLRAALVLAVFAIVAHSTIKGPLASARTAFTSYAIELPFASLAALPLGTAIAAATVALGAIFLALRARAKARDLILGGLIGGVAVLGWATTSVLLFDEFDPLPIQSAAFSLPWSDTLFWVIASSAIPAGFGTGFIGGVLAGAFASAATRGELQLVSFEGPAQTTRYLAGAGLMGFGGVLAGGCTVGAGLSGSASLSVAALVALAAIWLGGSLAGAVVEGHRQTVAA